MVQFTWNEMKQLPEQSLPILQEKAQVPNPCCFLQSLCLPRHGEDKDPFPLWQDKYFSAAGMERARQQVLEDEMKTVPLCFPNSCTSFYLTPKPARHTKDCRVWWLTKGEQQQLMVITDFLLELQSAAKWRLCRQRKSDAKADPWATAAADTEETGGQKVVQNGLQKTCGFWGRTINSLTNAPGSL